MTLVFKIKVLKWSEHNPNPRKSYKKSMIANRFVDDAKIVSLPLACRWMFLALVLRCGDSGKDTITMTQRQVNDYLTTHIGARNALARLQELQLVSFEEIPVTVNSTELKRKEMKRNKGKEARANATAPEPEVQGELLSAQPTPPRALHPLIQLWNENCAALSKVKQTNATRDRKIVSVWKSQSSDAWKLTIGKIATSDFCNGKSDRGWKATFDWLLQPETWLKVNEGKYDNRTTAKQTAQGAKYDNLDALERKWSEAPK